MDFGTYTYRQQQIIRREISILQVDVQELRRILTKAVFSYDEEAFRFAMRELERRKVYIYVKSEEIERLIRKAERYSDDEVAEYFRSELKARDEWKDKNRPYSELQQMILASLPDIEVKPDEEVLFSKDSSDSSEDTYRRYDGKTDSENLSSKISHLRDEEYYDVVEEYNRSKPYTARQMKLIDGTISLSEASNHELSRLVKKAKDQEDYETAEMIGNYLKMHRGYYRRADSKKSESATVLRGSYRHF